MKLVILLHIKQRSVVFFIFTFIFFQKHSLLVKTRLECPLHSGFVLHNTRAPPTDLDVIKYHTKPVSYLVSELLFMPLVGVPTYFYGLSPTQDEKKVSAYPIPPRL